MIDITFLKSPKLPLYHASIALIKHFNAKLLGHTTIGPSALICNGLTTLILHYIIPFYVGVHNPFMSFLSLISPMGLYLITCAMTSLWSMTQQDTLNAKLF